MQILSRWPGGLGLACIPFSQQRIPVLSHRFIKLFPFSIKPAAFVSTESESLQRGDCLDRAGKIHTLRYKMWYLSDYCLFLALRSPPTFSYCLLLFRGLQTSEFRHFVAAHSPRFAAGGP